jgi:hypothetical protein
MYVFMFCLSFQLTSKLQVCDNVGDHLIGNVYARYEWETEAQAAVDNLNERWYAGECQSIRTENRQILI